MHPQQTHPKVPWGTIKKNTILLGSINGALKNLFCTLTWQLVMCLNEKNLSPVPFHPASEVKFINLTKQNPNKFSLSLNM